MNSAMQADRIAWLRVSACTLPGVQRILAGEDDAMAMITAPFSLRLFGTPLERDADE